MALTRAQRDSLREAMRSARLFRLTVYQRWEDDLFYAARSYRRDQKEDARIGYWQRGTEPGTVFFTRLRRHNEPIPIFEEYPPCPLSPK